MTDKFHLAFWGLALVFLALFVYLFQDVLAPFLVGTAIAYLLNPLVLKLETQKIPRIYGSLLLLTLFFVIFSILIVSIVPPLYREVLQLAESAPAYLDILFSRLEPYLNMARQQAVEEGLDDSLREVIQGNVGNALSFSSDLVSGLLSGGRALVGVVTFIVVTPLVAFFVMQEWPAMTKWIDGLIPRDSYDEIEQLLDDVDRKIAGFVRGQMLVALSLGVIYAIALAIAGLEYGFLIGLAAGLLSIIPLFGSVVGLLVGVIVAWVQAGSVSFVLTIAGIFLIGQLLEGNFITPKLLGGNVGMHPLWILFSIMAGATLFGIVGMMISVPVAATAGVIINFALQRYKESKLFSA